MKRFIKKLSKKPSRGSSDRPPYYQPHQSPSRVYSSTITHTTSAHSQPMTHSPSPQQPLLQSQDQEGVTYLYPDHATTAVLPQAPPPPPQTPPRSSPPRSSPPRSSPPRSSPPRSGPTTKAGGGRVVTTTVQRVPPPSSSPSPVATMDRNSSSPNRYPTATTNHKGSNEALRSSSSGNNNQNNNINNNSEDDLHTLNESTRNLVKRFIADIWNRGEIDLIPVVCSPQLRFNGNTGFDRIGHDGLARMVATIRDALDDYHCEIHSMVVENNKAFCRLRFTGKHTGPLLGYEPTRRVVAWMGATEFTCMNGKILKVWELGDVKSLEEQLMPDHDLDQRLKNGGAPEDMEI